jgi:hypothetical protein
MKHKIIPAAILLMIMAIISLPSQSNEYTGKAIRQTSIRKAGAVTPAPAIESNDCSYTASPTLLLLSL